MDSAIADTCDYLKEHYSENITLEELTDQIHLSKSWLLHTFTKQTGVSPYRYLQSIRLEEAKKLLEQAVPPIDAAARAGFTDQKRLMAAAPAIMITMPTSFFALSASRGAPRLPK